MYSICACVCARTRARACVCVCVRARSCVCHRSKPAPPLPSLPADHPGHCAHQGRPSPRAGQVRGCRTVLDLRAFSCKRSCAHSTTSALHVCTAPPAHRHRLARPGALARHWPGDRGGHPAVAVYTCNAMPWRSAEGHLHQMTCEAVTGWHPLVCDRGGWRVVPVVVQAQQQGFAGGGGAGSGEYSRQGLFWPG